LFNDIHFKERNGPDPRFLFGVQLGDRIDECLLFTLEGARGYEPGLTSGFPKECP
jgi:hypothetical protein